MSGNKLAIFNVGGAFSCYCEIDGKRIVIDLGKSDVFSPVKDFLIPYAKAQKWEESSQSGGNGKFHLDQLVISHPHKDHISDIQQLWGSFYPQYATTPNDNVGMADDEKINWKEITTPDDPDIKFLRGKVIADRKPPLVSTTNGMEIFYLPPKINEKELPSPDYTNNLSLICVLQVGNFRVVIPGDIMPSGMDFLLDGKDRWIKKDLTDVQDKSFERRISKKKIDILVAPHHGLKSSFSTDFMKKMDVLKLVVIPEKIQYSESKREVDPRYYSSSSGMNIYDFDQQKVICQKGIKTSGGHIVIGSSGVSIMKDANQLLKTFLSI